MERDFRIVSRSENRFVIQTTRSLSAGEGLTVLATFQKGLIPEPTGGHKFIWLILDNIGMAVLLLGGCGLFGYYLFAWNKVGKDPEKGTIIPLFEAPAGVSPAAASYLHFWGFRKAARKPLAFIAAIVSLAVKGRIRLRNEGKTIVLEPAEATGPAMSAGESVIARRVHARQGGLAINKANAKTVTEMRSAFRGVIKDDYDDRYIRNNTRYFVFGVFLSIATIVAFFLLQLPVPQQNGPLLLALIGGAVAATLFFLGLGWVSDLLPGGGPAILGTFYMLIGVAIWLVAGTVAVNQLPGILVVAAVLLALIALMNVLMFHLLRAPTIAGRKLLDRIEGFKLYLSVAEAERMNLVGARRKSLRKYSKSSSLMRSPWALRSRGPMRSRSTSPKPRKAGLAVRIIRAGTVVAVLTLPVFRPRPGRWSPQCHRQSPAPHRANPVRAAADFSGGGWRWRRRRRLVALSLSGYASVRHSEVRRNCILCDWGRWVR